MESKLEKPIIFSSDTDMKMAQIKLQKHSADEHPTRKIWLLRESSVSGLLTVSFYCRETASYSHQRIGFVSDQWRKAPQDKNKAIEFADKATAAFKDKLPENSVEKLFSLLKACGFKLENSIIPTADEVTTTTQYSGYFTEYGGDPTDQHKPF